MGHLLEEDLNAQELLYPPPTKLHDFVTVPASNLVSTFCEQNFQFRSDGHASRVKRQIASKSTTVAPGFAARIFPIHHN